MATVRYIVHRIDEPIAFYRGHLAVREVMYPAPAFAMLSHAGLRLELSAPGAVPPAAARPLST
jgi:hypothetical protein